jgi:hypothetical protein
MKRRIAHGAILGAVAASIAWPFPANAVDLPQIPSLPTVTVLGPNSVKLETALNPLGQPLKSHYECGTVGLPSVSTPTVEVGAGLLSATTITGVLDNLVAGRTYTCHVVAGTPAGQVAGSAFSFSTPSGSLINPETGAPVKSPALRGAVRCTIMGTKKADRLKGTSKRDVICGLGGNDRISGGRGNDVVYGGAGRDRLRGGRGKDRLYGNSRADRIVASDDHRGGDRVDGGGGKDRARLDRGDRVVAVESVSGR